MVNGRRKAVTRSKAVAQKRAVAREVSRQLAKQQQRKQPQRKRGTIGVPRGRGGATITQAGQGLLRGSARRSRNVRIGVVPVGRKAINSGLRRGAKRSTSVNVVRRTEFAQRTGIIPKNVGSGEFKFPNLTSKKKSAFGGGVPNIFGGKGGF